MTKTPDGRQVRALELANDPSLPAEQVVERARVYAEFLQPRPDHIGAATPFEGGDPIAGIREKLTREIARYLAFGYRQEDGTIVIRTDWEAAPNVGPVILEPKLRPAAEIVDHIAEMLDEWADEEAERRAAVPK